MKRTFLALISLSLLTGITHARTGADAHGRKIEGELVSQNETGVALQLAADVKPIPATGKYAAQWTGTFEQGNFGGKLPFLLRVPMNLKTGSKYPLLLFLHGSGERGNDNKKQLKHDPTKLAPTGVFENNPMIVVAPQCPIDQMWSGQTLDSVIKMVKDFQKELPVDPQRIYITGISMGGYGTWSALALEPRLFAAAIPICGAGDPKSVHKFDKVPIWAFHSDGDPAVNVEGSRSMIAALKKAGGDPKYTEYQSTQHDAWTRTYKDPALWEWLLAQKKKP